GGPCRASVPRDGPCRTSKTAWERALRKRNEPFRVPKTKRKIAQKLSKSNTLRRGTLARVAPDYGLTTSSLYRHRTNCLKLASSNAITKEAAGRRSGAAQRGYDCRAAPNARPPATGAAGHALDGVESH